MGAARTELSLADERGDGPNGNGSNSEGWCSTRAFLHTKCAANLGSGVW